MNEEENLKIQETMDDEIMNSLQKMDKEQFLLFLDKNFEGPEREAILKIYN